MGGGGGGRMSKVRGKTAAVGSRVHLRTPVLALRPSPQLRHLPPSPASALIALPSKKAAANTAARVVASGCLRLHRGIVHPGLP